MRWRLSVLMFLQYSAPGALLPLFSLRLQELGFSPLEMGYVCSTQALAALIAPFIVGQIADRWYAAERCLAICALLAGTLLWFLAELNSPGAVFATCLAFWLVMVPVFQLGTALSFAQLTSPRRDFGPIRMWGTVGWMVPGWLLGYWFTNPGWLCDVMSHLRPSMPHSELADAFRLAGLLTFLLSIYALTLPHTPPRRHSGAWLAPLAALQLLRRRSFAVFCICAFGVCVTIPFTSQLTPLLLEHQGTPRPWIGPTLTIAQSTEVILLALLPMLLTRFGFRATQLAGLAAWALALAILTAGQPPWLVIGSLALNGLCICCFLVAGQVFVNSRCRGDIRVSAQGLLTFVTGSGMVVGNLLVGWVRGQADGEFPPTFAVSAVIAVMLLIVFYAGFAEEGVVAAPALSVEPVDAEGLVVPPSPAAE